jgi:gluconokinase
MAMDFVVRRPHHPRMAQKFPCSPYQCEQGLFYFPRMLDKIRLRQRGELAPDYHANLGKGFDQSCCEFFHVGYADIVAQVEAGRSDAEVFAWCCQQGRHPDAHEIHVWNEYMRKRGWNDEFAERLRSRLEGLGMAGRADVLTMFDLLEVDEGRLPRGAGTVS